jgi:hypothetical protein
MCAQTLSYTDGRAFSGDIGKSVVLKYLDGVSTPEIELIVTGVVLEAGYEEVV